MHNGELIYTGWRESPARALLHGQAAEVFATTHDCCLILQLVPEDEQDRDTADGWRAMIPFAGSGPARQTLAEPEQLKEE